MMRISDPVYSVYGEVGITPGMVEYSLLFIFYFFSNDNGWFNPKSGMPISDPKIWDWSDPVPIQPRFRCKNVLLKTNVKTSVSIAIRHFDQNWQNIVLTIGQLEACLFWIWIILPVKGGTIHPECMILQSKWWIAIGTEVFVDRFKADR